MGWGQVMVNKKIIDLWNERAAQGIPFFIERLKEHGLPIPNTYSPSDSDSSIKTKRITIRLGQRLHDMITHECAESNLTATDIIRKLLEEHYERR